MSSLVLAPMGIFLTYKSNKDSVVFNIDVYKAFFRYIFGLRQSRHIFKKEVIIYSPDYSKIYDKLNIICKECEDYSNTHKLLGPPNYYKIFTNHTHDDHIKGISQEIESIIEELSNSKDAVILNNLNNYPFLFIKAHKSISDRIWLNILLGIIIPAGFIIWLNIWKHRVILDKDLKTIIKTSRDIQERIKTILQ